MRIDVVHPVWSSVWEFEHPSDALSCVALISELVDYRRFVGSLFTPARYFFEMVGMAYVIIEVNDEIVILLKIDRRRIICLPPPTPDVVVCWVIDATIAVR